MNGLNGTSSVDGPDPAESPELLTSTVYHQDRRRRLKDLMTTWFP